MTSSDFPRILPHPNRLTATWEPVVPLVARNQVLHGPQAASRLRLPVVEL